MAIIGFVKNQGRFLTQKNVVYQPSGKVHNSIQHIESSDVKYLVIAWLFFSIKYFRYHSLWHTWHEYGPFAPFVAITGQVGFMQLYCRWPTVVGVILSGSSNRHTLNTDHWLLPSYSLWGMSQLSSLAFFIVRNHLLWRYHAPPGSPGDMWGLWGGGCEGSDQAESPTRADLDWILRPICTLNQCFYIKNMQFKILVEFL